MLVFGRDGSYGRAGVVAGDGNHRHCSQSGHLLHLFSQGANDGSRHHDLTEHLSCETDGGQQSLVELLGARVEYL